MDDLCSLLERLAPPGAACSAGEIGDLSPSPYPEEEAAIAHTSLRRQREFRAGRHHARQAMERLSLPPRALPRLPSRTPSWPPHYTGSISHSHSLCAALVANGRHMAAIGVDIEPIAPTARGLARAILSEEEIDLLDVIGLEEALLHLFAAKEAAFKAGGRKIGLRDIRLGWTGGPNFAAAVGADGPVLAGSWGIARRHVAAIAWKSAP